VSSKRMVTVACVAVQSKLLSAVTLVDKYGHEGLWHRITRWESKVQVTAKFSGLQQDFHDISQNVSHTATGLRTASATPSASHSSYPTMQVACSRISEGGQQP
jgi:hypothetical protein